MPATSNGAFCCSFGTWGLPFNRGSGLVWKTNLFSHSAGLCPTCHQCEKTQKGKGGLRQPQEEERTNSLQLLVCQKLHSMSKKDPCNSLKSSKVFEMTVWQTPCRVKSWHWCVCVLIYIYLFWEDIINANMELERGANFLITDLSGIGEELILQKEVWLAASRGLMVIVSSVTLKIYLGEFWDLYLFSTL